MAETLRKSPEFRTAGVRMSAERLVPELRRSARDAQRRAPAWADRMDQAALVIAALLRERRVQP